MRMFVTGFACKLLVSHQHGHLKAMDVQWQKQNNSVFPWAVRGRSYTHAARGDCIFCVCEEWKLRYVGSTPVHTAGALIAFTVLAQKSKVAGSVKKTSSTLSKTSRCFLRFTTDGELDEENPLPYTSSMPLATELPMCWQTEEPPTVAGRIVVGTVSIDVWYYCSTSSELIVAWFNLVRSLTSRIKSGEKHQQKCLFSCVVGSGVPIMMNISCSTECLIRCTVDWNTGFISRYWWILREYRTYRLWIFGIGI